MGAGTGPAGTRAPDKKKGFDWLRLVEAIAAGVGGATDNQALIDQVYQGRRERQGRATRQEQEAYERQMKQDALDLQATHRTEDLAREGRHRTEDKAWDVVKTGASHSKTASPEVLAAAGLSGPQGDYMRGRTIGEKLDEQAETLDRPSSARLQEYEDETAKKRAEMEARTRRESQLELERTRKSEGLGPASGGRESVEDAIRRVEELTKARIRATSEMYEELGTGVHKDLTPEKRGKLLSRIRSLVGNASFPAKDKSRFDFLLSKEESADLSDEDLFDLLGEANVILEASWYN
jgi:hypothetical protein